MNSGIYYLYEYRSNSKLRNVGFLKISMHSHSCDIQINARQVPVHQNDMLTLCVLFDHDSSYYANPLNEIPCSNNGIAAKVIITDADIPSEKGLSSVHGMLLLSQGNTCYAAMENDFDFDADALNMWTDSKSDNLDVPQEDPLPPDTSVPDISVPDISVPEMSTPAISEPNIRASEAMSPEAIPEEVPPTPTPTSEVPILSSELPILNSQDIVIDAEPGAVEDVSQDSTPKAPINNDQIRKIQRSDISILPRRVWNIANNSFLLHGYHNYNHLLLVEEDGHYWIGVPGLFSKKEERAAELFGFPQFTNSYADYLELTKDERSESESFGHWCRYIR